MNNVNLSMVAPNAKDAGIRKLIPAYDRPPYRPPLDGGSEYFHSLQDMESVRSPSGRGIESAEVQVISNIRSSECIA